MAIPSYPHIYFLVTGCYLSSGFGAVQGLHGRNVWVCVLQGFHMAAGSSRSQRCWYQQQGWSGRCRGAARYQQQLLQQAGLSLGFPFCHSKPLMRLSSNELVSACAGGLWCCRPSSSSQGAECPRDPLQDWLCSRRARRTCRPRVGTLQCFRHPFL